MLVYHENSALLLVSPCDMANESNSNAHRTAEEIHRTMDCQKFRNYRHLYLVSNGSELVNRGEFPPSLGSFATIPRQNEASRWIAPGTNTLMRFTWILFLATAFQLVALVMPSFLLTVQHTNTGHLGLRCFCWIQSLPQYNYSVAQLALLCVASIATVMPNCLGLQFLNISLTMVPRLFPPPLSDNQANGRFESHWETMVHMARAYLTEKQKPCGFCFFAINHPCCAYDEHNSW